jgi:hypothetical protein
VVVNYNIVDKLYTSPRLERCRTQDEIGIGTATKARNNKDDRVLFLDMTKYKQVNFGETRGWLIRLTFVKRTHFVSLFDLVGCANANCLLDSYFWDIIKFYV